MVIKDYTNIPKSNYTINTAMSIQDKLLEVLEGMPPSLQLKELENLSMKLRKENGLRINNEVDKTRSKYPKIKR